MANKLLIIMVNTDPSNGPELGAPFFQATGAPEKTLCPSEIRRTSYTLPGVTLCAASKPATGSAMTATFLLSGR